jgi:3-hydroxy acid dehydrogenase / malonic semialdehyde reductase
MTRFTGRSVLITGATSGIGEACARRFAAEGAELILWARRMDRLEKLAADFEQAGTRTRLLQLDVRDRDGIFAAAAELDADSLVPHVLINNAGLASGLVPFQDSDPADWDVMIDTNVKGLLNVSRAVMPLMIREGRGHIINIGSLAGRMTYPKGHVYAATKYAVRALTEGLNLDAIGTNVRVSSVDPGLVETEFSVVRFHGDADRARQVYSGLTPLTGADVADTVFHVAAAPEHVNILEVVMTPTAQRNVYVVQRES